MTLKTLHGEFEFAMQKYQLDDISLSFLELTQPEPVSYVSRGLQEFSVYYSNRMSYREVTGLVERQCGRRLLSEQTIWQMVQQKGLQVSDAIERSALPHLSERESIEIATAID